MAAPYTARAAAGAPVAAPLTWEEVAAGKVRPTDFTIRSMPERLQTVGDLFVPVLRGNQALPLE
jgi:bifunctional non-homologous end joining protein LigD